MIRVNIDLKDKLVNGKIGTLQYIEWKTIDEDNNSRRSEINRLWLSFTNKSIGRELRRKFARHIASHPDLQTDWVPIKLRKVQCQLNSKLITCKRKQFPVVESCAMTVHKAQGDTYQKVVYEYSKSHERTLVYIALSRATNIEGLFLINRKHDYKFYHKNDHPNYELQREFALLESRRLTTIGEKAKKFILNSFPDNFSMCLLNVQSLKNHIRDSTHDFVIPLSKILTISETWLDNYDEFDVPGYDIVSYFKRTNKRVGGAAILIKKEYKNKLHIQKHRMYKTVKDDGIGDICAATLIIEGKITLLICLYLSCSHPIEEIKNYLNLHLDVYQTKAKSSQIENEEHMPLIVVGDFNVNFNSKDGEILIKFLNEQWNLHMLNNKALPTTKNQTCIDAIFVRNLENMKTMRYISYFSHHRPLLSIIPNFCDEDQ